MRIRLCKSFSRNPTSSSLQPYATTQSHAQKRQIWSWPAGPPSKYHGPCAPPSWRDFHRVGLLTSEYTLSSTVGVPWGSGARGTRDWGYNESSGFCDWLLHFLYRAQHTSLSSSALGQGYRYAVAARHRPGAVLRSSQAGQRLSLSTPQPPKSRQSG